jgi:hypothetical protein
MCELCSVKCFACGLKVDSHPSLRQVLQSLVGMLAFARLCIVDGTDHPKNSCFSKRSPSVASNGASKNLAARVSVSAVPAANRILPGSVGDDECKTAHSFTGRTGFYSTAGMRATPAYRDDPHRPESPHAMGE